MTVEEYEYVKMSLKIVTKEVITQYELHKIAVMAGYILKSARACQASSRPGKLHTTASKPT